MPHLKLTYFDIHGGRGEVARLAFFIGGVPFEDNRVKFPDWPALKPTTPFNSIPVLEVDGQEVTQSNGINRYAGKLSGLYPADPLQAAFCDEAMDAVEEIYVQLLPTFTIKDEEEKKARRKELADGPISLYLSRMARRLEAHGGQYFAGGSLSVGDIKVSVLINHLKSGNIDHIPVDLADRVAPSLVALHERVQAHPKIKEYYESRR